MIGEHLPAFAKYCPDKIAIKTEGLQITYAQVYENIKKLQFRMQQVAGAEKGKKVAIFIGNTPAFLEVFFAAATLGWIGIPIDPKWTDKELQRILAEIQPNLAVFQKNARDLPVPSLIYDEVMEAGPISSWVSHPDAEQNFYIGFTSGSSGRQKGYTRNHRSWLESFRAAEEAFNITAEDCFFAPGPFCHSLSLFAAVHALHIGATVYITERFDAGKAADILKNEPITLIYAVPTMIYAITNVCKKANEQIRTLQKVIVSGSKWEAEQKKLTKEVFPSAERFEFYGASELSFISYVNEKVFAENPKSIGIPFPGVNIRIVNAKGESLPSGAVGEVFVKSDFVFSGYVNAPELNDEVFNGDYVTVGDIGYIDENGYLLLAGRKKNMIISGGLNIYPEEVEEVLKNHPFVKEAVVAGISDPYWGEKLTAFIEWEGKADTDSLDAYCRTELPAYKCPKEYIAVESFPMTASGKVARNEFHQTIEKRMAVHQ